MGQLENAGGNDRVVCQNSVGLYAALEVGADLALDEASDGGARCSRALDEGLELFADDVTKESFLGLVAFVGDRGFSFTANL